MSIITGRGDDGDTDLLFNRRIAKTSARIEAIGCVDELNAALGLARATLPAHAGLPLVDAVQEKLVGLMGLLATLPEDLERYANAGLTRLNAEDVAWIEAEGRRLESGTIRFHDWARPGSEGCAAKAALDFARTIARRAERAVLRLHEKEPVPGEVRLFLNRLADLLWLLARSGS
jgi:cob(I)alamin adenosyltransferase